MRISKLLPAICVVAFCASFISVRADDTPSQAAARAALEAKMNALNAPQVPPENQTPVVNVSATGLQPEKSADTNDTDAAEQALRAKMADLDAQENNAQTSAPPAASAPPADSEAMAKAQAALEEKMSQLNQQPVKPPALAPAAVTPASATEITEKNMNPENVNYTGKELGLKPIEAPPLPISAEKQAQLQALDAKYMANQITPEEYHKQRAEILGGQ